MTLTDEESRDLLLELGSTAESGLTVFYDLRCYWEAMEAYLSDSETDRATHLERNIQRLSPTVREYVEKHRYNPRWEHLFPTLLRKSVIVSIMSAFEHYLNDVCAEIGTILRCPITHRDLKDKPAQTYLRKIGKIERPHDDIWTRIYELRELRNLLVHHGGVLEAVSDQKKVQSLVKKLPGVSYKDEEGFAIQPDLCLYCLDRVEKFTEELIEGVKPLYSRIQRPELLID